MHHGGKKHGTFMNAKYPLQQDQVAGTAYRQKFG
jgi:hypothetical protein